ncbi:MAG TPA: pilus assembly protein TadG-related protein [Streptosporangiales bacterium]
MTPRRRAGRDSGQTTVLIIGYAVLAMLLVTVVVNLSKVFLAQRSLDAAADAAAIAGAQAVRVSPYYRDGALDRLPLAESLARQEVYRHLRAAGMFDPARSCDEFTVQGVSLAPAGDAVDVTVSCRVRIPFANVVSGSYAGGVPVTSTAHARTAVRP